MAVVQISRLVSGQRDAGNDLRRGRGDAIGPVFAQRQSPRVCHSWAGTLDLGCAGGSHRVETLARKAAGQESRNSAVRTHGDFRDDLIMPEECDARRAAGVVSD